MHTQLSRLVKQFRDVASHIELEVRIQASGKKTIEFDVFLQIYKHLEKLALTPDWTSTGQVDTCDFFFPDNVRTRSRIGFTPVNVIKQRIASLIGQCPKDPSWRFHFCLSSEIPCVSREGHVATHVRLQQVWEYTYKHAFTYVLKKVASGPTKEEAAKNTPCYELEIELVPNSDYLKQHTDEYVADSMIDKSLDLIGRQEVTTGKITSLSMKLQKKTTKRKKSSCPFS